MEKKYRISPNIVFCFGYLLLNLQLTDGAVTVSYTGTPYLGQSFMMKCTITSFTGTATWAHDGTTHATCGSTFCSPPSKGNYTFSYSGSTLSVTIDPVLSSDQGKWQCTHTSGSDSYVLNPQTSQSTTSNTTSTTTQSNTTQKPTGCGFDNCQWVFGFGSLGVLIVILIIVWFCKRK